MQIHTSIMFLLIFSIVPIFIGNQVFSQNEKLENWKLDSLVSEKTSEKGNLLIQLKSSLTSDPTNFPLEIVFLNSTLPKQTPQTVP